MKNIFVVSGSGQVTSETVADKLNSALSQRGVSDLAEVSVIKMEEIDRQVTAEDLVVSTMILDKHHLEAPVFSAFPFLTGIRVNQEVDKIVYSL
ncbi:MAG: hypothetical protein ACC608_08550 [Anaerofustis sp.]